MPAMENAAVAGTVAVVGLGTTLFTSFMPDMSELRVSHVNETNSVQVRHAQLFGSATTMAFSVVVGYWARSPIPVLAGLVTAAVLCISYELSLRETGVSQ